jgi:integrase
MLSYFVFAISTNGARMRAKRPLTDRGITGLKPALAGKRILVWDAVVPGLAVRVTDTGAKSFVLVSRYPGSPHPTPRSLGKVGAITLADARELARDWIKSLRAGIDPATAAQAARDRTFRAICEQYLAREGSALRTAEWRRWVLDRVILPALGDLPITEIRRSDIVQLLDGIADERGPVMANRALGVVRRVMNWYATRSDDFRSPIVRGMARAETARERVLADAELRALWSASFGSVTFGAFFRFLLLTAARRGEAAEMQWSEISEDGVWTLPASRNKTGQVLLRPLSAAAQDLLAKIPRNDEFVFTLHGQRSGLVVARSTLGATAGVEGWTLHDCRRTARSLMSRAGVPNDHAERCLGHVIGGVRGVYDRHEYLEEKRKAFEALARMIEGIVA